MEELNSDTSLTVRSLSANLPRSEEGRTLARLGVKRIMERKR